MLPRLVLRMERGGRGIMGQNLSEEFREFAATYAGRRAFLWGLGAAIGVSQADVGRRSGALIDLKQTWSDEKRAQLLYFLSTGDGSIMFLGDIWRCARILSLGLAMSQALQRDVGRWTLRLLIQDLGNLSGWEQKLRGDIKAWKGDVVLYDSVIQDHFHGWLGNTENK